MIGRQSRWGRALALSALAGSACVAGLDASAAVITQDVLVSANATVGFFTSPGTQTVFSLDQTFDQFDPSQGTLTGVTYRWNFTGTIADRVGADLISGTLSLLSPEGATLDSRTVSNVTVGGASFPSLTGAVALANLAFYEGLGVVTGHVTQTATGSSGLWGAHGTASGPSPYGVQLEYTYTPTTGPGNDVPEPGSLALTALAGLALARSVGRRTPARLAGSPCKRSTGTTA